MLVYEPLKNDKVASEKVIDGAKWTLMDYSYTTP